MSGPGGHLGFWLKTKKTRKVTTKDFANRNATFKDVQKILYKRSLHPLYLDMTAPEISELGLHVTKVLVPELVQLSLPSYPFLQNPRFYSFIPRGSGINPYPHPLP